MTMLNEEYKQEINSIFGELYEEIFKNRLTSEISESLKATFKKYKNKHDEELTREIKDKVHTISDSLREELEEYKKKHDKELRKELNDKVQTISDSLRKELKEYKNEYDKQLRKDVKNEIRKDINESIKSVCMFTKKMLNKYLLRKETTELLNARSKIVVLRWLVIFSVLLNIITLILVIT